MREEKVWWQIDTRSGVTDEKASGWRLAAEKMKNRPRCCNSLQCNRARDAVDDATITNVGTVVLNDALELLRNDVID